MIFEEIQGTTSIDLDEKEGLLPQHIELQQELNEWEQSNILKATTWLAKQNIILERFATVKFCQKLHKQMFNKTWKWAGTFRKSNKNIGIDWPQIGIELKKLFDDLLYQVNHNSYKADELAARFHHRLVYIHAFTNGNGRHARLAANQLLVILGQKPFTWGYHELITKNDIRKKYIKALQKADKEKKKQ
jgi:Fic-DOC domain mobile mystery protein B